jgi:hypothetical protein
VEALAELPMAVKVLLVVVVLVQVTLAVVALVVLFRTPPQRVQFGSRWPWLALILLLNLIGPILFLAVGRKPAPAPDRGPADSDPAGAMDVLYGDRSPSDDR